MNMKTTVTVTGAAGQIGYAFVPRLGEILDHPDKKIHLKLLEVEQGMPRLEALVMELEDCAFPFISDITYTSDTQTAFEDCDWGLFFGAQPRTNGMERADLLKGNAKIFQNQGTILNQYASRDFRAIVIGNPCNTNAYVLSKNAPDIDSSRFYAMSMLDQNRAVSAIAKQIGCEVFDINDLYVWGNHSPTMYSDYQNATVYNKPLIEIVKDENWLKESFLSQVAQRGSQVIKARGASSALSAASAAIDTLIWLVDRSAHSGGMSLGVCSQGEYGSQPGNIVSMPCIHNEKGELQIIEDIPHDEFAQSQLAKTFAELADEVRLIHELGLVQ